MDNIQYAQKEGSSILLPVYNGRTIDKMPELVKAGQTPISGAEIMEQRIKAWQSDNQDLAKQWGTNYFDSGDGIMYHPDGRIKVVPDSQTLRNVNCNTPLRWYGSQVLSDGAFDKAEGIEFSRKDVKKFANKYLKQGEVSDNPIWLALARDDKELLKEYVGQVYSRINDPDLMKIWVSEEKPEFEAERLWCLGGLGYSNVIGNYGGQLGDNNGRLVGVAPEVPSCVENSQQSTQFNLEGLIGDINTLRNDGHISPALEKVFEKYQI